MSKLKEEWKPVVGFEGLYEVSDWGSVASLDYNHTGKWGLLSQGKTDKGYKTVVLYKDGVRNTLRVYWLVWDAFIGEDRTGLEVNHIDEDKNNNAVWNLNLLNHKDNLNWGTHNKKISKALTNHPDKSKPVIALDTEGNIIYEFVSTAEAGRNGFSQGNVAACCRGERKTHQGLFWRYKIC